MISEAGERDRIKDKQLEKYANVSAGMPFSEGDMKSVQEYAKAILSLYGTREYVAEYVRTEGKNVIPNLSAVAGPLIAFRLVALAGGLEKLAKMSSSTVQLLGAEKALFRHLRGQGRAPKFGVIFAHQAVQNAPRDDKGRVARTLASKLSLAARADFYTGKNISDKLISDFKKKSTGGHKPKKKAKSI
jgi:nucleolar protein 56